MYKSVTAAQFGHAVKVLRTAAGLSQMQLANRCRLTSNGMSLVERGVRNPSWELIQAIAFALHVPVSGIFKMAESEDLMAILTAVDDDR